MLSEIRDINSKMNEMKDQINEIYYKPGYPGYIKSQTDFENSNV